MGGSISDESRRSDWQNPLYGGVRPAAIVQLMPRRGQTALPRQRAPVLPGVRDPPYAEPTGAGRRGVVYDGAAGAEKAAWAADGSG